MTHNNTARRSLLSLPGLFASVVAVKAYAQFGGRSRDRGESGLTRSSRSSDANPRAAPPAVDPVIAIQRELPSLRIDLKLTTAQVPLFDSFEHRIRIAADAERTLALHVSAFRVDDGSTVTANAVLGTVADDDTRRADAARGAVEQMTALYAALKPDQRMQFDRRIIQALREPLGNS